MPALTQNTPLAAVRLQSADGQLAVRMPECRDDPLGRAFGIGRPPEPPGKHVGGPARQRNQRDAGVGEHAGGDPDRAIPAQHGDAARAGGDGPLARPA